MARKRFCSTLSGNSSAHKRGSDSVFVIEGKYHRENQCHYLINQEGTMKSVPITSSWCQPFTEWETCMSNSCNGLALIQEYDSFFLCNPLTGYSSKVLMLDHDEFFVDHRMDVRIGLCFDESANDYKAVLHFCHDAETPDRNKGFLVIEATLKGKKWTKVESSSFCVVRDGVSVNNKLHWLVSDFKQVTRHDESYGEPTQRLHFHDSTKMIQYDPVSSVLEEFPSPLPERGFEDVILGIGVLEGCLWMARRVGNKNDDAMDVEVLKMKEYGVEKSWTSMFVMQNVERGRWYPKIVPLLITQDGEFLYSIGLYMIMAYNIETNLSRIYYKSKDCMQIVSFEENFVSPEGYYWNQDEHKKFEYCCWDSYTHEFSWHDYDLD